MAKTDLQKERPGTPKKCFCKKEPPAGGSFCRCRRAAPYRAAVGRAAPYRAAVGRAGRFVQTVPVMVRTLTPGTTLYAPVVGLRVYVAAGTVTAPAAEENCPLAGE